MAKKKDNRIIRVKKDVVGSQFRCIYHDKPREGKIVAVFDSEDGSIVTVVDADGKYGRYRLWEAKDVRIGG